MTPQAYFHETDIQVVIGLHKHPTRWWAQASKTLDGISVKVEAHDDDILTVLQRLQHAWQEKTEILPAAFSTPPLLAAPVEDATFNYPTDEIPF